MRVGNGSFSRKIKRRADDLLPMHHIKGSVILDVRERVASLRVGVIKSLVLLVPVIYPSHEITCTKSSRVATAIPRWLVGVSNYITFDSFIRAFLQEWLWYMSNLVLPRGRRRLNGQITTRTRRWLHRARIHRNRGLDPRGTGRLSGLDINFLPVRAFYCWRWSFISFRHSSWWPQ